ncbi:hypothetical protein Tco_0021007, partial [Tanacetum coccineum]
MCTYMKNMARFTHNQLKNKSFEEVQKAFDETMSWIDLFVPMDSEVVKGKKDKVEGSETREKGSETRVEGSSKRTGDELQQESSKKQKVDDNKEKELKLCFEISLEDEDTVDVIPLAVKPAPIIFRVFNQMLKGFDREDLETMYRLVKDKYKSTKPVGDDR